MKQKTNHQNFLNPGNVNPIQMGFWVPNRIWATARYLIPLRKYINDKEKAGTLNPMTTEVQEFKNWINRNSIYRMWLNSMISESNDYLQNLDEEIKEEIKLDGDTIWIESFDKFFITLNEIITTSPSFNKSVMVGTPLNAFLAVSMATKSGVALFHDTLFNLKFKEILNAWNAFLKSYRSLDKLDIQDPEKEGSWISKSAWNAGVWDQMEYEPLKPAYGFDSWNSFFIRKFISGARPFLGSDDVINIGCETTPWEYANAISLKTDFWIKDTNYSLLDLFAGQGQWARLFEGGQLYQGFLSATHYHRWNAPLNGELIRSWIQPGTYFAQRPTQGEDEGTWEGTQSQPYLGHVAARAIFIFKHPKCGYIALLCVGMVEVSTCVIKPQFLVEEGDDPVTVNRGEEIGHFEFGGSTHIMIFQKDKVLLEQWAIDAENHQEDENPIKMGTIIAHPKIGLQ